MVKMTTAQVVETSVTVNNNSPIQDYVHPDDQTQPTFVHCKIIKISASVLIGRISKEDGHLLCDKLPAEFLRFVHRLWWVGPVLQYSFSFNR